MRHFEKEFSFPRFFFIFTDGGFLFPHSFFQHSVFQLHLACFVSQICPWFCPSGSLPIQHGDAHTPSKEWLSFKLFLSLFVTLCVCVCWISHQRPFCLRRTLRCVRLFCFAIKKSLFVGPSIIGIVAPSEWEDEQSKK